MIGGVGGNTFMMSSILYWALRFDEISPELIMVSLSCEYELAYTVMVALNNLDVVSRDGKVLINDISDMSQSILEVMEKDGFTSKMIEERLRCASNDIDAAKKKVGSKILTNKMYKWKPIDSCPENYWVVIRMQNPKVVLEESKQDIIYLEDIKIAKHKDGRWIIKGPFPLYDYSPCSKFQDLNEGVEVTHWASVNKSQMDELDKCRNTQHEYQNLTLRMDEEQIEGMYRAIILAGHALIKEASNYPPDTEINKKMQDAYKYIIDLQVVMDKGGTINAMGA